MRTRFGYGPVSIQMVREAMEKTGSADIGSITFYLEGAAEQVVSCYPSKEKLGAQSRRSTAYAYLKKIGIGTTGDIRNIMKIVQITKATEEHAS